MLSIKGLSKRFSEKTVLDDISLNVGKGQIAVLLGSSGVGKSTLLRVLNNLESADAGKVYLDERELNVEELAKKHLVGMVFQQFNLFNHLTAQENITIALKKVLKKSTKEANKIAGELLDHYGLADLKDKYPSQLSGGQKQRLAIARSLAMRPEILCLDEPTSALDPLLTNYVAKTIQGLADEGFIILVATHDIALLNKLNCDIYLMKEGKIIEHAQSKEFEKEPGAYPIINTFVQGN